MASSGKSKRLGLSLWEAGDRPERLDFVGDNQKLEELVGGHLEDTAKHLTAENRSFLTKPFWFYNYTGTGRDTMTLSGISLKPRMMLVFCNEYPPVVPRGDGKAEVYWDYWLPSSSMEKGHYGGGGAVALPDQRKIILSNVEGEAVWYYLNKKDLHYNILCLGTP